jgi:hypothetical protein
MQNSKVAMNRDIHRRDFLQQSVAVGAGVSIVVVYQDASASAIETTQPDPDGFFTLDRRKNHWWLITADGKSFFSMGLHHIDPVTLRYPENIHLWRDKNLIGYFYIDCPTWIHSQRRHLVREDAEGTIQEPRFHRLSSLRSLPT